MTDQGDGPAGWPAVRETLAARTDRQLAALQDRWPDADPDDAGRVTVGPRGHEPAGPPTTVDEHLAVSAGIASVVLFYTAAPREAVLVYNPAGAWEPPGGVVERDQSLEAAARTEAREETGLTVALTDLLYTGRVTHRYASGAVAEVPLAAFVGHRVEGALTVEREGRTYPGTCRAVGLFDRETLPAVRRDGSYLEALLGPPPAWDGPETDTDTDPDGSTDGPERS